ncbi:MAG: asparagine synthetase A [Thermofilum sp.]|uniref:Aminoacyl-transfer RNA synthetases class-II family profile domain-containing protein n=1 Tax=Thermofilum pendens TaxID=2269 RepID=A0A7C4D2A5_THEPE
MRKGCFHPSLLELEEAVSKPSFVQELESKLSKYWRLLHSSEKLQLVLRVQAALLRAMRDFLDSEGFVEVLPPIIGPVTDPGIRGAKQVVIDYYGRQYKLMSSAILYKQMLASSLGKIYFASPNVRLEDPSSVYTGRHLVEFVQLDLEIAEASYREAMRVAESLLKHVVEDVLDRFGAHLEKLGRQLTVPRTPFRRYTYTEVVEMLRRYGVEQDPYAEISWENEELFSSLHDNPFFVTEYPITARGFYDREDPSRPGVLLDFDLLYPEGFGEAASGAEREYEYEKVLRRLIRSGEDPSKYGWYLEMLKDGIKPSAGFGIGVERLTRYVCGLPHIYEARPYPKLAGITSP